MSSIRRFLSWLALLGSACVATATAQEIARVENTATLSFGAAAERRTVASNTVALTVTRIKRPTTLSFRLLDDDFPLRGLNCVLGPVNKAYAAPIDAETLAATPPLATLDLSRKVILVFENEAGNHDPLTREDAFIKATARDTSQMVRLVETAPNSGVFAGGVPALTRGERGDPCYLDMRHAHTLDLSFDEDDFSYASTNSVLIDPAGFVFDSWNGAAVDGAVVTLLDDNDRPATVFGDDGVSRYPSTVTSGAGTTDASGRAYHFPPGFYRFPLTYPGRYHLKVEPPTGYTAPSKQDRAFLATLRNPMDQPFLLNEASFGGKFDLITPDPFYADIPVDRPKAPAKRPTTLSFRLLDDDFPLRGLNCVLGPVNKAYAAPIDAETLAATPPLATLDLSRKVILVFENEAGNHDPLTREDAFIKATARDTSQMVRLVETAPNSGVFAGGVPALTRGERGDPCYLDMRHAHTLDLSFDEDDFSYASTNSVLIDPAGFVFDSRTGAHVDGAVVTLLDDNDQPAVVFGDDGITRYPSTVTSGGGTTDASGRAYHFPPGFYRFPLTYPGRYHLKVEPPTGYTAPSKQDRAFLATLRNPMDQPFLLNEASFGGKFDLITVDPFYADIPVDGASETRLLLTKTASVRDASAGDVIQYRITLANRDATPVRGVVLTDTLPPGLRYERGSQRDVGSPDVAADGRTLTFAVPLVPGGGTLDMSYVVSVAPGAPAGEAVNRVRAGGASAFAGISSNEAAAAVRIRPLLFTDGFTVIGRVTEGACGDPTEGRKGVAGVRLLMEDGTFVVTDRVGLYHFEGVRPGRHLVQIDTGSLPASHAPVACDADTRTAGSATSRFVESGGGLLQRVDFQLRPTGEQAKADLAAPTAVLDDAVAAGNRDWFAGQEPGVALLFPGVDHNPRAPALRVVVKHAPGQRVALTLNGAAIDPIAFDTTDTNPADTVAISRWTGLPLVEGDNRLVARVLDAAGATVATLDRVVHSASVPATVAVAADKSRLVADGVTRPLIAVRVTDRDGRPVRAGTLIPFRVDQPHLAAIDAGLEQTRGLDAAKRAATARVVGDDGVAFIALEPTTQAGAVRAHVSLTDGETTRTTDLRAWLTASAKTWIVVGFGSGTLGHETLRRRGQAIVPGDTARTITDGQLALYAKGRIKGQWLATIAYDSDRRRDRDRGLLGTIDPDRYYTVYGDGTRQGYDAATAGKLYLRLEHREFYALFGDYETGLTDTQLGRYSRTLNGGKMAFEGGRATFTAFAAHTDERYGRDEIQGNGLSGPYRLSGRGIVPNSDKVRIEVRDRFRSELILSSTQLTRHIDYDIDPDMGTLRFREPVLSRDPQLNPRFIVAEYETEGRGRRLVAGGRGAVRLAENRVEIGATALRDESSGVGTMLAIDARARPTRTTELRAEAARGGRGGLDDGRAWLIEAEHHGAALDLTGYARRQDIGFGLGQQNIVEAGTRKIGVDGTLRLGAGASISGSAWHQERQAGAGSRVAADVRLDMRRARGTVFVGAQLASDRGVDGRDRDSRLLTLGGTQGLFGGRLAVSGQTQIAPGGDKGSVDFPIRHQLTAPYRVLPGVRLLAGYEIADGKDFNARTAQWGFDVAPWTGAKLMSTLNRQSAARVGDGENGERVFAQYGLNQSLPLGQHWTVDATLDASSTVRGRIPEGAVINAFQPVASGGSLARDGGANGDYAAVTLGAAYRGAGWSWNGRAEYRDGERGDRAGLTTNVLRPLGQGRTLAASLRWFRAEQESGAVAATTTADVALAWRPLDSRWSVLERLTVRREQADAAFDDRNVLGVPAIGGAYQAALRLINNLAINYRSGAEGDGHGVEATAYYGAKWVRGSFGADDYSGYIDVIGFDLRHDLGRRFDIGVQGSVQHAWRRGTFAWSVGPSVGVSPARDVWLTAGFNVAGYRDRDFEADRYTRAGPFVTMRVKFDQLGLGRVGRATLGSR